MVVKDVQQVSYRRFLFRTVDYFLCKGAAPEASINYYIQCNTNLNGQLSEFHTLLLDLGQSPATLFSNIQKSAQTEILSFLRNQSYEHEVKQHLSPAALKGYIALFNGFAKHKKIRKAETARLRAYNREGLLAVSFIRQHNNYLCLNFYRVNVQRATNLHSFHLRHVHGARYSQSHLGRAHRLLHWLDILAFKAAGIQHYDFCGWYAGHTDQALLGINRFKEQFAGKKVTDYSGVIYTNKFLRFLKNLR